MDVPSIPTESRELPSAARVAAGIRGDRAELTREILLWQRTIRYGAVIVLAIAGGLMLRVLAPERSWLPLGIAAGLYLLVVAVLTLQVRNARSESFPHWVPAAMAVADVIMCTTIVFFAVRREHYHLALLFGYLVLQFAVFYFGWRTALPAAALAVAGYVFISLRDTPYVAGGVPPGDMVVGINAVLFVFVLSILFLTFGTFRERLEHLRIVHKRVEIGDLGASYAVDKDKRIDDLTFVGRGFNDMRDRIAELIGTDPLTGCMNRRQFETRLSREWRQARRRNASLALLAIDLDHFKEINDRHGHPIGDGVLRDLGDIMKATARDTDAVGRIGGDEFVILLPDTGWQGAMTFAERLRKNVDDHAFGTDQLRLEITVSVGVATQKGSDDLDSSSLMEAADRSLYRAKSEGRNRICA